MPNHIETKVTITGLASELEQFKARVMRRQSDEGTAEPQFDFNQVIPMPEILSHTSHGYKEFDGVKHTSWYSKSGEPERPFTASEQLDLVAAGGQDWYMWRVSNWGTKWNSYDFVDLGFRKFKNGNAEWKFIFNTAWDTPGPVMEEIAGYAWVTSLKTRIGGELDGSPYTETYK